MVETFTSLLGIDITEEPSNAHSITLADTLAEPTGDPSHVLIVLLASAVHNNDLSDVPTPNCLIKLILVIIKPFHI